jgi:TolB protein
LSRTRGSATLRCHAAVTEPALLRGVTGIAVLAAPAAAVGPAGKESAIAAHLNRSPRNWSASSRRPLSRHVRRLAVLAVFLVAAGVGSDAGSAPGALLQQGGSVVVASSFGSQVAGMDGRALRRLTRDGYDADPVWSPDARRIAFSRLTGNGFSVLVMSADGSGVRRVGGGYNPSWSPDGTQIAFDENRGGVAVVSADGTRTRRVADRSRFEFSWSPDGKRIAYSDREETARIHLVEVASGASTTLGTSSFKYVGGLAWSPDGTTIAFEAAGDLYLIDADTGRVRKLTDGVGPVWSPDGARIAFFRDGLFTIGRDGSGQRRLAPGAGAASWSSDGGSLVFERRRFAGSYESDIWRVAADGTGRPHPVTHAFPTGASYSAPKLAARTSTSRPSKTAPSVVLRPFRILRTPTLLSRPAAILAAGR